MIREMENYIKKNLVGKISFEYEMSEDLQKKYDLVTIKQETLGNILYYTMCFDHTWNFEDVKGKIDNTIINSIMNRFINKGGINYAIL